jgi:uncharacterized protein
MATIEKIEPWYKQFWPWFIFGLPALVVVASIITVIIAFKNQDSLVADDYYKDGLAINRVLEQDDNALKLLLAAELVVDGLVGELQLSLQGELVEFPSVIELRWIHPTDMQQDFSLSLKPASAQSPSSVQRYMGQLDVAISGRWYVQLLAQKPVPWRLRAEIDLGKGGLSKSQQFSLGVASDG